MNVKEYFGDWWTVIDEKELTTVISKLQILYKQTNCTPSMKNIFKAFELCSRRECRIVILSKEPYLKGEATGLAFANNKNQLNLNFELEIIKNVIIDLENPKENAIFDPTLESIAQQGVLWLNTALTAEMNNPEKHLDLWKPFIQKFLYNFCLVQPGTVFILMGAKACEFIPYLGKSQHIIECGHPSYYYRTRTKMPNVFTQANDLLIKMNGYGINWYSSI